MRERNRRERGAWEAERSIRRYILECGECVTYHVDPKDLKDYSWNKELVPLEMEGSKT